MEIVLRPLALLVLLLMAYGISRLLYRIIPAGRVKDILYKRHSVIPEARRH
jgi:hypothetical protein